MDRPLEASRRQEEASPNLLERSAHSDSGGIEAGDMRHDNDASSIAEFGDSNGDNERPNMAENEEAVKNEEDSASRECVAAPIEALYDCDLSYSPLSSPGSTELDVSDTQPHDSSNQMTNSCDRQEEDSILVSRLHESSDKTFQSFRKLEKYVRRKAVKEGFNFTTGHSSSWKNSKELHRVELLCHMHNRGWSGEKRPKGKRFGTGCTYRVMATQHSQGEEWSFEVRGEHNHPREWSREALAKAERLPMKIKKEILKLIDEDKRPREIYELISYRHRRHTLAWTKVRSFCYEHQAQLLEDSTPAVNLFHHLSSKNFFTRMMGNENRDANRIFFASRGHARLLCHYGNVLVMDCTYKTNRYKLPLFHVTGLSPFNTTFQVAFAFLEAETESFYVWALKKLKELYPRGKGPSVLITGQNLALAKAIGEEFPDAKHLLCKGHIKSNVNEKVRSLRCSKERKERLKNDWFSCMQAKTEEEFNRKYQKFKEDYADLEDLLGYLKDSLEPYKEKYVDAWVNKVRHYGIAASSRVEGSQSHLKNRLRSRFRELTYVVDEIDRYCKNELENLHDKVSTDRSALLGVKENALFAPLILGISNFCMKRMKNEYEKIDIPDDVDIMAHDSSLVSRIQVLADDANTCECESKVVFGIPCQHILALRIIQKRPIALDDIDEQWTISYPLRYGKLFQESKTEITEKSIRRRCEKAIELMRHHNIRVQYVISQHILSICKQPLVLRNVAVATKRESEFVGSLPQEKNTVRIKEDVGIAQHEEASHGLDSRKRKRMHAEDRLGPTERSDSDVDETVAIESSDDIQQIQQGEERRVRRKRQCSKCHQSGHDLRNCPENKSSEKKKDS